MLTEALDLGFLFGGESIVSFTDAESFDIYEIKKNLTGKTSVHGNNLVYQNLSIYRMFKIYISLSLSYTQFVIDTDLISIKKKLI